MKKPVVIILAAVTGLLLLVAIFVGVVLGIVSYSLNRSDAAQTARTYLRGNARLKEEIGEIKDFGWFITGRLRSQSSGGQASLSFKVYGERKTVTATVTMISKEGRGWHVAYAEYVNDQGRRIVLFDPYEPDPNAPAAPEPVEISTP